MTVAFRLVTDSALARQATRAEPLQTKDRSHQYKTDCRCICCRRCCQRKDDELGDEKVQQRSKHLLMRQCVLDRYTAICTRHGQFEASDTWRVGCAGCLEDAQSPQAHCSSQGGDLHTEAVDDVAVSQGTAPASGSKVHSDPVAWLRSQATCKLLPSSPEYPILLAWLAYQTLPASKSLCHPHTALLAQSTAAPCLP